MKLFESIIAYAQTTAANGPLVPDCPAGGCGWDQLFELFQNILTWIIWASIPVATLAIAYAGWKIVWGSATPGSVSEGKKILWSTIIGFAAVLAAFLIVKAILGFLASEPFSNLIE